MKGILGIKVRSTQLFSEEGKRLPITEVKAGPCVVVQIKQDEKDGYKAVKVGIGEKKARIKGATKKAPLFIKEIRTDDVSNFKVGSELKVNEIFKVGEEVKVTGWSKGKGFAGVVKRWHFKGGPRTHGQSDRERAPGSIGQTTTPGRVFKGKKMAGHMGLDRVTVKGLKIVAIDEKNSVLSVSGLLPGAPGGLLLITK